MATYLACRAETFELVDLGEVHSAGYDVEPETAMLRSARQSFWARVVLAATLLSVAVYWPLLEWEDFPHGPVLFAVGPAQGLVASDLFALIPLALAMFVIRRLVRR
jgi:hypothetical protein